MSRQSDDNSGASAPIRPELFPGIFFLIIGVVLLAAPLYFKHLAPYLQRLSLEIAAAFLVAAAGFVSSTCTRMARARGRHISTPFVRRNAGQLPSPLIRAPGLGPQPRLSGGH